MTQLSSFLQSAFSMWKTTSALFWGPYCFVYLFFLSLITVLVLDKQSERKMTYAGYSLLVLFALYNPIVFYLCRKVFGESTAYFSRLYSLLPVPFVIAYSAVFIFQKKKQVIRLFLFLCLETVIILGGKSVYSEDWIAPGENPTKLSNEVLQVCDIVHGYKEHVCIAVPQDLATYIRQYDGAIIMPYGRDMYYNEMREAMKPDVPDIDQILAMAGEKSCDFLVVKKNADNYRHFEEHNQLLYGETENHLVYLLQNIPRIERQYNDFFQITEERNLNAEGHLIINSSKYASAKYEYDAHGNCSRILYFDENSNPCLTRMGYYGVSRKYNTNRLIIEETYLDSGQKPFSTVIGCASMKFKYDNRQRKTAEYYYDTTGEPAMLASGQFGRKFVYQANNHISRIIYTDNNGTPILTKAGYSMVDTEYDSLGNLIAEYYLNEEGTPVFLSLGEFGYQKKLNSEGQTESLTYVNAERQPSMTNRGYATIRYIYDAAGNPSEEYYLDEKKQPVALPTGQFGLYRTYNEKLQISSETYLGINNQPILLNSGYSTVKYKYDAYGNKCEEYFYGIDEQPVPLSTGEYGHRFTYNDKSQVQRLVYLDASGMPMSLSSGISGVDREYDQFGHICAEYYIDQIGNATALSSGQYGYERVLDQQGNILSITYTDINHLPTEIGAPPFSTIKYEYNNNKLSARYYYNLDGQLVSEEHID